MDIYSRQTIVNHMLHLGQVDDVDDLSVVRVPLDVDELPG